MVVVVVVVVVVLVVFVYLKNTVIRKIFYFGKIYKGEILLKLADFEVGFPLFRFRLE